MNKLFGAVIGVLSLAACTSTAPYYAQGNFQAQSWATQSFDQAKAACRYETLHHNQVMDTYELETPRYKACMEKNGYRFTASTDAMTAAPLQPAIQPDTAPLYR